MNKQEKDYYNKVMQDYFDKFKKDPPTRGAIHPTASIEYAQWVESAINDNKAIDLDDYYSDDEFY